MGANGALDTMCSAGANTYVGAGDTIGTYVAYVPNSGIGTKGAVDDLARATLASVGADGTNVSVCALGANCASITLVYDGTRCADTSDRGTGAMDRRLPRWTRQGSVQPR